MALFGFPEHFSDYTIKDYLRIFVIIAGYLILRPHLVRIGERIQEKRALEATSQDSPVVVTDSSSASSTATKEGSAKKRTTENNKKVSFADDMPSDEDVADLLE